MTGRRSREPFWWSLFSAGGVLTALFIPAFILGTGFVLPLGSADGAAARYAHVHELLGRWWVWPAVLAVLGLGFFHCAHRIRHVLMDLGLREAGPILSVACYGAALAGSIAAGVVLVQL